MYDQKKLIDGIREFSPAKESWIGKPSEELPEKVTVSFEAGPTGILDMANPRAVIWAKLLDLQRRYKKPVYVEIDPETQIITQLLIPEISRVMSLTDRGEGDVNVIFYTSQALHYLRRGNPDFQRMLDALNNSKDSRTATLVTATREDHEIIDVRPLPNPHGAGTPSPPNPPQPDPPVSPQRAQDLFDLMNSKSCDACAASCSSHPHCIPFKHADDGCYARAHEMCRLMMDVGEAPEKVWIYGGLHVATSNVHQCDISWSWHVAPTLMVTPDGVTAEKYVIDPSLCAAPVTVDAWKALQDDPGAVLRYSSWVPFWSDWWEYPESEWPSHGIDDPNFSQTDYYLELKCTYLQQDCDDYGPPPYVCPIAQSCHFIVDRSTFSEGEIDAMLHAASPAVINAAFYVVVDGFAPEDLNITAASLSGVPDIKPVLTVSPAVSQMAADVVSLDVEDPSRLKRRQRLTWTYKITFAGTNGFGFAGDILSVALSASISSVSGNAGIYLIKQPNPFEIDGETSWLSTDLRVFQLKTGESKFGVTLGSDATGFITQAIGNLNSGNSGGQTFENDISTDQQTSRLEISQTVDGAPVYNFAVAKVRYLSLIAAANSVRVFFRLIPWATTSVEYDQTTAYRRHESGNTVIPLLGIKDGRLASIPCFASPRVDSSIYSLTTQADSPNVLDIPSDAGGAEVVRYFGCWLDINQPQEQFPVQPSPVDGPYPGGRVSIQEHIRGEHQCLVAEIAFNLAPIPNGASPSTSDKLAQRNLAIVDSANPGLVSSRRIPQTFEIRPSKSKNENDELMFDWGNVPLGSVATIYLPGFNADDILSLAVRKYRRQRMVRIDQHTIKFDTGGITYLPIPRLDGAFPGLLTVDLPEGVKKGQIFKVIVRQVTGERQQPMVTHTHETLHYGRRIIGSFQLTIPVRDRADILPSQSRLLSNLRWIERAIPASDPWLPVFVKYTAQIAQRVDSLGGDSGKVAPSASGQWREAYLRCRILALSSVLLIAMLIIVCGLPGLAASLGGIPIAALLAGAFLLWRKRCRPTACRLLGALFWGPVLGALVLILMALFGMSTPRLMAAIMAGVAAAGASAVAGWLRGCCKKM